MQAHLSTDLTANLKAVCWLLGFCAGPKTNSLKFSGALAESTGVVIPFILSWTLNQLVSGLTWGFSAEIKSKLVYFQPE